MLPLSRRGSRREPRHPGAWRKLLALASIFVGLSLCGQPSSAGAFKVAALGDVGCPPKSGTGFWHDPPRPEMLPEAGRCRSSTVARMVAGQAPRFTIVAGDLVHGPKATSSVYGRRFGRFRRILHGSILPTPGNHDVRTVDGKDDFAGYFRYWLKRSRHPSRLGQPEASWASYNVGRWHFVNLNSNCRVVDCTLTGPQVRWLLEDLKKDRADPRTSCVFAYMHHPRFSSGASRGKTGDAMLVSNLWEVLYRYRTDVLITGHQHYYERYVPLNPGGRPDPTGIVQYISGTGGSSLFRPAGRNGKPARGSAAHRPAFGATMFRLGRGSYRSSFMTVGGRELDALTQPVKCLRPNAGASGRRPRSRRYRQRLHHLRVVNRKLRRISRRTSARGAAVSAERRIDRLRERRERLLNKPLYR